MSDFAPRSRELGSLLLGGGVFLVIGAVVLSLLESSYSGSAEAYNENQDLEDLVKRGQSQLAKVNVEIGIERDKLVRWEAELAKASESRRLEEELAGATSENADLTLAIAGLEEKIEDLESERVSYRGRMREWLWPKFINQELKEDDLLTSSGFKNAIISGIDAAGLMIRHQAGVARVPVAHLTPGFREKLDLNLEEASEMMAKIYASDARRRRDASERINEKIEPLEIRDDVEIDKDLARGKAKVIRLQKLIVTADAEAANARTQDRRSKNRSAPGSLETWIQRANRYEQLALKYRNQLAITVEALRELDPSYKVPGR